MPPILVWLEIVLAILKAIPTGLEFIAKIIDAIRNLGGGKRIQKMREFNAAWAEYKKTGKKEKLDALYAELCPGGVCPTDSPFNHSGYEGK